MEPFPTAEIRSIGFIITSKTKKSITGREPSGMYTSTYSKSLKWITMKDMFLSRWSRSSNSYSKTRHVRDSMLVKRMSAPKATSHKDVMLSWFLVCKYNRQPIAPTEREFQKVTLYYKHNAPMEQGFFLLIYSDSYMNRNDLIINCYQSRLNFFQIIHQLLNH